LAALVVYVLFTYPPFAALLFAVSVAVRAHRRGHRRERSAAGPEVAILDHASL
jgi:hypothetical protein